MIIKSILALRLLRLANVFYWIIVGYLLIRHKSIFYGVPEAGEVIILSPFCLVCYMQFFTVFFDIELRRDASFWIVTGMLFYIVLLLPTLFVSQYYFSNNRPFFGRLCFSVNGVALIVSYLFYAKGMIAWTTK
jgi:hypothetical protein